MIRRKLYSSDIETDGFDPSLVWVTSITELDYETMKPIRSFSLTKPDDIQEYLAMEDIDWIFHNGHHFDKPVLDKLIAPIKGRLIDTLGLSWYLYPKRHLHGLASWGEEFGIPKPEIEDWEGLELSEYVHRCEEDVKIQTRLWRQMWKHLMLLYRDVDLAWDAVWYISDKMWTLALQNKSKWKADKENAAALSLVLHSKYEEAQLALEKNMPRVPVYAKKTRPKKPYKINGDLSVTGEKWLALVLEHKKPFDFFGEIKVLTSYKEPNAGSPQQIKAWLYDLGWEPTIFKYVREEGGGMRAIPQIRDAEKSELCLNIVNLIRKHPALSYLKDIGVIKHRIGIVDGFLSNMNDDDFIVAGAQGFTNTLRLRHKVAVNIPSVRKPWGMEIRSLLIARRNTYELLGSDMSSLEDRTKQHYMWSYDPEYVKDMMKPDFDPHCDMAIEAGMMTLNEAKEYKDENTGHDRKDVLSLVRYAGKTTNYAATYGAGGPTIARAAGVAAKVGDQLHEAYWRRNWSLKAIADDCEVKESRGMKWLWNPVAKMWYYLKAEKDRFSTLNQGTGSFLFDQWVFYILRKRPQINGQFHDEVILEVLKGNREPAEALLREAIDYVNKTWKLNRDLDIDVQFGDNYAQIH